MSVCAAANPVFFAVGLVITGVTLVIQILVSLGRLSDIGWPIISASSVAGRVAAVALHATFVLFCLGALATKR